MTNRELDLLRKLRAEVGCTLLEAAQALEAREGIYDLMLEYVQRKGLAISIRGTPAQQEEMRYPKWAAHKRRNRRV